MLATIITITDRLMRFLAPKYFMLIFVLICSTQIFAEELDISDIEKALNTDLKGELSGNTSISNSENPETKKHETKPIENNIVTDSGITIKQQGNLLTTSIGENDQAKKVELLPQADKAKLIVLNKITTKSTENILKVGEVTFFGNLSIEVHKCIKATDPYNANNWMLLTIFDNKIEEENLSVFHGWVLSSNPSLSTLEHPVYEVIPLDCLVSDKK